MSCSHRINSKYGAALQPALLPSQPVSKPPPPQTSDLRVYLFSSLPLSFTSDSALSFKVKASLTGTLKCFHISVSSQLHPA